MGEGRGDEREVKRGKGRTEGGTERDEGEEERDMDKAKGRSGGE